MTTRENTAISAAEQVYGMPKTIPGQFHTVPDQIVDNFLQPASTDINTFYPDPLLDNLPALQMPPSSIPTSLQTAEYILVQCNRHESLLKPLCDGPFKVLTRGSHNLSF
jgi:hypothetical protein